MRALSLCDFGALPFPRPLGSPTGSSCALAKREKTSSHRDPGWRKFPDDTDRGSEIHLDNGLLCRKEGLTEQFHVHAVHAGERLKANQSQGISRTRIVREGGGVVWQGDVFQLALCLCAVWRCFALVVVECIEVWERLSIQFCDWLQCELKTIFIHNYRK